VAFLAFRQWLWARNLETAMMKHLGKPIPPATSAPKRSIWSRFRFPADVDRTAEPATVDDVPTGAQRTSALMTNPWTRTHSHFALMGGFAFDAGKTKADFMPDSYTRLTLTSYALRKLADLEPTLIPDLSERAIKDKSKANWLAKSLVCLQACWFIVQVVGRAATSAPISLLEMNTFLHALCCLVIYLAWWHKPLDIEEPELIRTKTEKNRKICAWMIMNSKQGASRLLDPISGQKQESAYLVHSKDLYKENTSDPAYYDFTESDLLESKSTSLNDQTQSEVQKKSSASASHKLWHGQTVNGFYLIRKKHTQHVRASVTLDPVTLECLRLADSLRTDPESKDLWRFDWSSISTRPTSANMVLPYISDLDELDDLTLDGFKGSTTLTENMDAEKFFYIMLMLAGSIYGLVHLIAWNGPFTSLVQRWMWRGSCLIIASPTVIVMIGYPALKLYDNYLWGETWAYVVFAPLWIPCKIIRKIFPSDSRQWEVVMGGIFALLALIYLAARVFLLVECFINLSQLPPEVYQVPQWAQYIPHLGGG
jgi:hypothetical protein